jgi:hypothetical protein
MNTEQGQLQFELLLSSTLHILSKAANSEDTRWSIAVLQHLELLLSHPDCKQGILRNNLQQLQNSWSALNVRPRCLH